MAALAIRIANDYFWIMVCYSKLKTLFYAFMLYLCLYDSWHRLEHWRKTKRTSFWEMEGILVLTFWLYLHIFVCVSSKIRYTDQSIGHYLLISESHDHRCIKIMLLAMLSAVKNICEWMGLCKDLNKFRCGIATGYHHCNTSVLEISSFKDIPWSTVSSVDAAKCKGLGTY